MAVYNCLTCREHTKVHNIISETIKVNKKIEKFNSEKFMVSSRHISTTEDIVTESNGY